MKCPRCHHEITPEQPFCAQCGLPLHHKETPGKRRLFRRGATPPPHMPPKHEHEHGYYQEEHVHEPERRRGAILLPVLVVIIIFAAAAVFFISGKRLSDARSSNIEMSKQLQSIQAKLNETTQTDKEQKKDTENKKTPAADGEETDKSKSDKSEATTPKSGADETTAKPTEKETAKPTVKPTEKPTPKPTEKATAATTPAPPPKPTEKSTIPTAKGGGLPYWTLPSLGQLDPGPVSTVTEAPPADNGSMLDQIGWLKDNLSGIYSDSLHDAIHDLATGGSDSSSGDNSPNPGSLIRPGEIIGLDGKIPNIINSMAAANAETQKENALNRGKELLDAYPSPGQLKAQLMAEGYTDEQAQYAVDSLSYEFLNCAVKVAQALKDSGYSSVMATLMMGRDPYYFPAAHIRYGVSTVYGE